ncbi:MAG: SDR family NAD(P)-dependent oxidoreductase [Clostridia bacterium]|nr:SDR family NAD(P)-dependent oxidoreductase [Clostridia bacterium]
MRYARWFERNTHSLQGKRVAIPGATGGIGVELCRHLARLGAQLVLCNRSREKTETLIASLQAEYPGVQATFLPLDLEDAESVTAAGETLALRPPHLLIHNAGAYAIPRHVTSLGVDNVYQINCLAPYILTRRLLEPMAAVGGHVVVVGSVAHNYGRVDPADPDFITRSAASQVYGNAKRHLMLALYERFADVKGVTLSVVHPGITFTNITAHYPPWLFAIIKHPMKVLFMPPRRAALSVVRGAFDTTAYGEWIGPWLFDVWGLPHKRRLHTFTVEEAKTAYAAVERLCKER